MKIAHVLTYISADGAFGGPLAVLAAQTAELARRGHHVEVLAGWDGVADYRIPGVSMQLFRTRRIMPGGFSGLVAPGLNRALRDRMRELDVVHIHLARDLVTTPAARTVLSAPRRPSLAVQTHGMVVPDHRLRARTFDRWLRPVLDAADRVFVLNAVERERVERVAPKARISALPNGVNLGDVRSQPVSNTGLEVLFLARLQPRKRVMLFAEAARLLREDGVADSRFTVVGPDEGDLDELRSFIARNRMGSFLRYEGSAPPGSGPERIAAADVYVLPSRDEPFPMSVLEALSVGTPTVVSTSCHIAAELADLHAVRTFDDDPRELAEVIRTLLADPAARDALRAAGRSAIEASYSAVATADRLEDAYIAAVAKRREPAPTDGQLG